MIRDLVVALVVAIVGIIVATIAWSGLAGVLGAVGVIGVETAIEVGPIIGLVGATVALWRLR
jgi:hypothetical protein